MKCKLIVLILVITGLLQFVYAQEKNSWVILSENQSGNRRAPGLIYASSTNEIILFCGARRRVSNELYPYNILSYQIDNKKWMNDIPDGFKKISVKEGTIENIKFNTPYFTMKDVEGNNQLNPEQLPIYNQYAYAPWNHKIYFIATNHFISYDLKTKKFEQILTGNDPLEPQQGFRSSYAWGSMCADQLNEEVVLFCGKYDTQRGDLGTWVYSTKNNKWTNLNLAVQPPVRAMSPMTFLDSANKIYLFGGSRLDLTYNDTWVYDCTTRTWSEKTAEKSPKPRFAHGFHALPGTKDLILIGGSTVRSSTSYCATMTEVLPFEMWVYHTDKNTWEMLETQNEPVQSPLDTMVSTLIGQNRLMVVSRVLANGKIPDKTFLCEVDTNKIDKKGTVEKSVKGGIFDIREKTFDPNYYKVEDINAQIQKQSEFYDKLSYNIFVNVEPPVWPERMGGGWSTTNIDMDNDQLLVHCGGHSSYYGNDVAHFDLNSGTWSISYMPQFALDYDYDTTGPTNLGFNGAPWGAHNYKGILYEPSIKRLVMMKSINYFYDPVTKTWPKNEWLQVNEFDTSKYTTLLTSTDLGMYAWSKKNGQHQSAIVKFIDKPERKWKVIEFQGESPQTPAVDGAGICYDPIGRRIILLNTTPIKGKEEKEKGIIYTFNIETNAMEKIEPIGHEKLRTKGNLGREAIVYPDLNLMVTGNLIENNGLTGVLVWDIKNNEWKLAEIGNIDVINRDSKQGKSVDLGLVYDKKRKIIWAIQCRLTKGCVRALKLNDQLKMHTLK